MVSVDDWDGFGQTLTASGTTSCKDVAVDPDDGVLDEDKFRYSAAFYQRVHLATLAGIGGALTNDVTKAVAERRRTDANGAGPRSSQDSQVVGRIRSAAYAPSAIVLQAAQSLELLSARRLGSGLVKSEPEDDGGCDAYA